MIEKVKHIGVAVYNIDDTMAQWSVLFGAQELKRAAFEQVGQTSALVQIGETYFELMEPLEGAKHSTVRKFLDTHGEGIHHISLRSTALADDVANLDAHGVRVLGAGAPVVFTHPKTSGGIVYEITEMED